MLQPLHRITTTARRLSAADVGERLANVVPSDELTKLVATSERDARLTGEAFDNQRRFIANVSHELRTPLAVQCTAIQVGFAESTDLTREEVRDHLLPPTFGWRD